MISWINIEEFLPVMDANFIKDVGFPIAAFSAIFGILIYVLRRDTARQRMIDDNYKKLVNDLLQTTKDISDRHETSSKELNSELKNLVSELKIITTKVDTYTQIIDKQLKAKSQTYIFKGDKIKKDR